MSNSGTLQFDPVRGLTLDLTVDHEDVALRMQGIPVPADGKQALRAAMVELSKLEILFKAQATIDGSPGQLQEAAIQLSSGDSNLKLEAKIEDVENGLLYPFEFQVPLLWNGEAPETGGPVAEETAEDDLDWDDETTYEHLVVDLPDPTLTLGKDEEPPEEVPGKGAAAGLKALLDAIQNLDEAPQAAGTDAAVSEPEPEPEPLPEPAAPTTLPGGGDLLMTPEGECRQFLAMLIRREELEIEDEHDEEELVEGLTPILQLPISAERKATEVSNWLLDQPAVADLYIGDEDLEQILATW